MSKTDKISIKWKGRKIIMRLIKKVTAVSMASCMALSLAACGSSTSETTTAAAAEATEAAGDSSEAADAESTEAAAESTEAAASGEVANKDKPL